eukprot:CAMPEP_0176387286 /NCGR_PEP_ID=MMETSP0126-20121128/36646_1 /TAXON_ID=141414 ORGANISM="Strombidinopsis acuminatum, Strain SPMC142" /NCGR_SAMPLE_ID=MMETSP0126 /ASSEMBLY_ACC=CAM_ASM_000229 /LENGTH=89 /DNA_ID=CAMNT_0017754791 /DNA_START=209 /DNA_END=478 /DNA_ORIENTATION=-
MREFFENFENEYDAVNDRAIIKRLDDHNGYKMLHYVIKTPKFVSNRVLFPTLYECPQEDGSYIFMSSTRGNEKWFEDNKELIGKLVTST